VHRSALGSKHPVESRIDSPRERHLEISVPMASMSRTS